MTRSARGIAALVGVLLAAALALAGCSVPVLDQGAPLEASSAPEQVARVLRLAGISTFRTGIDNGVAYAQVSLPTADSAAEVGASWMTAIAALREAFPSATSYKVLVVGPLEAPLIQLDWDGMAARGSDVTALRESARVSYPVTADEFTSAQPMGELQSGAVNMLYLDAKNRAAGISPSAARTAFLAMQRQAPGYPAPGEGEDPGVIAAERAAASLRTQTGESAAEMLALAEGVTASGDSGTATTWRYLAAAAESVSRGTRPDASFLEKVTDIAKAVASSDLEEGAPSDAVLVAAGAADAPESARRIDRFEEAPDFNAQNTTEGELLPNRVASALGVAPGEQMTLAWDSGSVSSPTWYAFRSPDGRIYWRSGAQGPAALTDASVRGIVYQSRSANLVDPANVGTVLMSIPLP